MKKYFALGLMIALGLTACQKDEIADATATGNQNAISHNFTVSPDEWSDGTRTVYEEGVGVHMTGLEEISVYYGDHQYASNSADKASALKKVTGTPNGAFDYTFSHAAVDGATAYDYYFVLPNTSTNNSQSSSHRPYVYLNTIQYPTATSFDPAQDYLIGTPKYGVDQSTEFSSIQFKRLFAPLRVTLTGIPEGEKVRYATLMQTGACNNMNPLVGSAYLRFEHIEGEGDDKVVEKSEDFADATINSWLSTGYGNKVTAYYGEGLATESGACDAWYVINPRVCDSENPTTISGDMTYWVVTDNKLITRTVTLAQPIKFTKYLLNKFSFNVTGEGYTEQKALTQDFTKLSSLSTSLTASDGNDYTWGFSNYQLQKNALYTQSNKGGVITLPTLEGCKVTKIMVLQTIDNPNNSNKTTRFQLKADDVVVGDPYEFNTQRMLTNSKNGYLVIDVPEEYQTSELALAKPADDGNAAYIAAITLVYEEDNDPSVTIDNVVAAADSFNVTVSGKNVAGGFWVLLPKDAPAPELEDWMDVYSSNYIDFESENPATFFVNSLPTAPTALEPDTEYELYVLGMQMDEEYNLVNFVVASQTIRTATNEATVTIADEVVATANSLTFDLTIQNADMAMYLVLPAGAPEPEMADFGDGNSIDDFEAGVTYSLTVNNCFGEMGELSPETEYTLYVFACQMEDMENYVIVSKTAKTATSAIDYYQQYIDEGKITISGVDYSQTDFGEAKLYNITELTGANLSAGGAIFVEGEGTMTLTANTGLNNPIVLVGRYSNQQPTIDEANFSLYCKPAQVAVMNMRFVGTNNAFNGSSQAANCKLVNISSCTIESDGVVIYDNNANYVIENVIVDNCMIKLAASKSIYGFDTNSTTKAYSDMKSTRITNNVIYNPTEVKTNVVKWVKNNSDDPDLNAELVVSQNTFYNVVSSTALIRIAKAKSVVFSKNVGYAEAGKIGGTKYGTQILAIFHPTYADGDTTASISDTYWYYNTERIACEAANSNNTVTPTESDNTYKATVNPFSSMNTTKYYFPIDTSVVTNGAGASYETKLWKNWAE